MLLMGEKGDVDELIFLGINNVNWLTKYQTHTITYNCYGLKATSPFRVASKRVSEQQSHEGPRKWGALTFFSYTFLSCLVSLATRT